MTTAIYARSANHAIQGEQRAINPNGGNVAKRKKKPATNPQRNSFIPKEEAKPKPTIAETPSLMAHIAEDEDEPSITLKTEKVTDREVYVTLTIPPLEPITERIFLPIDASPEQLASITGIAIKNAGERARSDGINKHAMKEQQDNEARERLGQR